MSVLVIVPTQAEYDYFVDSCEKRLGRVPSSKKIGHLSTYHFTPNLTIAHGGLGKTQFAVHTRHLLDRQPGFDLVICAGAAGALSNTLLIGDIVVANETVEHDIKNKFGPPRQPRFAGDAATIQALRQLVSDLPFRLHFAPVAGGDEDVIDRRRQEALAKATGAIAVAWEGPGGAKACQLSHTPFLELRGISDGANSTAASDFEQNLPTVMHHLAILITSIVGMISNK